MFKLIKLKNNNKCIILNIFFLERKKILFELMNSKMVKLLNSIVNITIWSWPFYAPLSKKQIDYKNVYILIAHKKITIGTHCYSSFVFGY